MSKHDLGFRLPMSERPIIYQPSAATDAGEPAASWTGAPSATVGATASEGAVPSRPAPSIDELRERIWRHVVLVAREFASVHVEHQKLSESVGTVVMRMPVANLIVQTQALLAAEMDLMRVVGRRAAS